MVAKPCRFVERAQNEYTEFSGDGGPHSANEGHATQHTIHAGFRDGGPKFTEYACQRLHLEGVDDQDTGGGVKSIKMKTFGQKEW